MIDQKLKRGMIVEAARMIYSRREADFHEAKIKAARRLCRGWIKPADMPTDEEIREEIQKMADLFHGHSTDEPGEIFTSAKIISTIQRDEPDDSPIYATDARFASATCPDDRFLVYRSLLLPLDTVMQDQDYHPEGDLLYHLMQC